MTAAQQPIQSPMVMNDGIGFEQSEQVHPGRFYRIGIQTATQAQLQLPQHLTKHSYVGDTSGLRPSNNATVGAQSTVDLKNAAGTVLTDADVLNEVLRIEILTVELESGDVLDLETGAEVAIQNLGDVAVWAYDSDVILQGSIANLSSLLADITSGIGDVYVQATAPVAGGVG